jgi:hypothetical protein
MLNLTPPRHTSTLRPTDLRGVRREARFGSETGLTNSVLTHSQQNLLSGHYGLIGKASAQEPATVGAFDLRFSDTGSDEGMTTLLMGRRSD